MPSNGATLTIKGRDAAGSPRAWYVRLWNYAVGAPEDAVVSIDVAALVGGYYVQPGQRCAEGGVRGVAPGASATLIDLAGAFEVTLARGDMTPGDADAEALDPGANLAIAGEKLIQFGRVDPLGGTRWRLTRLLRGRRGTEAAIGQQVAGTRSALLDAEAVRTIDLPLSAIGRELRVLATGVGDGEPVEARHAMTGSSVVPPSPAHLRVSIGSDGGAVVRWVRRSRAGWRWIDGVDAPIGEEREAYRVTVTGVATRIVETDTAMVAIGAEERSAGAVTVEVRQRGTFGESDAARIVVAALGE